MSAYNVAHTSGRALDCSRCNGNQPSAACSCIADCGANGCTGELVIPGPRKSVPTKSWTKKETK